MTSVVENEYQDWREQFNFWAQCVLDGDGTVSAEQVILLCGYPPHHQNSIGAMMRSFAKKHNLVPSYEKSKHPAAHARLVARWSRP